MIHQRRQNLMKRNQGIKKKPYAEDKEKWKAMQCFSLLFFSLKLLNGSASSDSLKKPDSKVRVSYLPSCYFDEIRGSHLNCILLLDPIMTKDKDPQLLSISENHLGGSELQDFGVNTRRVAFFPKNWPPQACFFFNAKNATCRVFCFTLLFKFLHFTSKLMFMPS